MNFTELRTEFFARGTDYLNEDAAGVTRADRWLNESYREILNLHMWSFLQANVTGADGAGEVSVPDLRKIRFVLDLSRGWVPLDRSTMDELADYGNDLALTGQAEVYYVVNGTTVRAFPFGGTLYVAYVKRVGPMSGTDTPVFSDEYHGLIVDKAMVKAYIDSDNLEAAAGLKAVVDEGLAAMAEDYQLDSREVTYLEPHGTDG